MALQTREQHIRREKATSNICTAQVLLAIISGMYAVYHGPEGLKKISKRVHSLTKKLASSLEKSGYKLIHETFFDTIRFTADKWQQKANELKINFRDYKDGTVGISLNESTKESHLEKILDVFGSKLQNSDKNYIPPKLYRNSNFLTHPVFCQYRSETDLLRYIHKLEIKDLSLNTSMIPLGSCTMKLNSTTEMEPITWPEFNNIHPF